MGSVSRRELLRGVGCGVAGLVLASGCDVLPRRTAQNTVPTIGYMFNGGRDEVTMIDFLGYFRAAGASST